MDIEVSMSVDNIYIRMSVDNICIRKTYYMKHTQYINLDLSFKYLLWDLTNVNAMKYTLLHCLIVLLLKFNKITGKFMKMYIDFSLNIFLHLQEHAFYKHG